MLSTHVEILESIGRLGVALALGSVIGFERQWRQNIAGLRTNALVALGSCGFVVFSSMVGEGDRTRVAAQVVTGIGFLCASTIMPNGQTFTVIPVVGNTTPGGTVKVVPIPDSEQPSPPPPSLQCTGENCVAPS